MISSAYMWAVNIVDSLGNNSYKERKTKVQVLILEVSSCPIYWYKKQKLVDKYLVKYWFQINTAVVDRSRSYYIKTCVANPKCTNGPINLSAVEIEHTTEIYSIVLTNKRFWTNTRVNVMESNTTPERVYAVETPPYTRTATISDAVVLWYSIEGRMDVYMTT